MRENGFLDEEAGLGIVRDLLGSKSAEVIVARSSDRVRDVIARMKAHGISQLPVLEDGRLLGALAEVDLLRYLVSGEYALDSAVGPLVESDYATVSPNTKIELLQNMLADARMAIVLDGDAVRRRHHQDRSHRLPGPPGGLITPRRRVRRAASRPPRARAPV